MTERDVAAEVLRGLQEVREHRAGKRTLRETRIEPTPISDLDPELVARIRQNLEGSDEAVSQPLRTPATCASEPDRNGESGKVDVESLSRPRSQGPGSRT